jgi:hypothetical protein
MQITIKPDIERARDFLNALDPEETQFTIQTFDDNADRKDRSLAQMRHGTLACL